MPFRQILGKRENSNNADRIGVARRSVQDKCSLISGFLPGFVS
jgi:hypothetical protein